MGAFAVLTSGRLRYLIAPFTEEHERDGCTLLAELCCISVREELSPPSLSLVCHSSIIDGLVPSYRPHKTSAPFHLTMIAFAPGASASAFT